MNVLITGAARRTGKFMAKEFAAMGWGIALHYNNSVSHAMDTASLLRASGSDVLSIHADIQDEQQIISCIDEAFAYFGNIDVLINNAGIFPKPIPCEQLPTAEWDATMNINLKAQFIFAREYAKRVKTGSIINFASLGGLEVWKDRTAYNVSKAGVIQLTKSLARNLAPRISVNAICPGTILFPDDETNNNPISLDRIPAGRYGNGEDIFQAVRFFATCSNYITGQVVSVDGGYGLAR